jgi:hypothetical protein
MELGWGLGFTRFAKDGSTDAIRSFARRTVAPANQGAFTYLQSDLAFTCGDWKEFLRLKAVQRYYDGDTDNPKWGQDTFLAEGYAEVGDMETARARASEALAQLEAERGHQPNNSVVWADLSLAHALLGHKQESTDCARKSAELLPEARDAIVGPVNALICAVAMAYAGEKDRSIEEIRRLLSVPHVSFANVHYCRVHFRPLQDDPRFKALLSDPANNAPFP